MCVLLRADGGSGVQTQCWHPLRRRSSSPVLPAAYVVALLEGESRGAGLDKAARSAASRLAVRRRLGGALVGHAAMAALPDRERDLDERLVVRVSADPHV
jgi:hypothetical protein